MADTMTAPPSAHPEQDARLAKNFAEYEHYLARAEGCLAEGELAAAAVHCTIASHIAVQNHCGVFWSPRLESILNRIGRAIPDNAPVRERPTEVKRILQVGTQMAAVGGLTKMLSLWVNADATREHSLVLTQQHGATPVFVRDAFGGRVENLNHRPGGFIEWAKRLREIARGYDLVILHTHCEDVVPLLAFADPAKSPPIVILNHADHLFWFGPSIAHLSINLRDAAQDLAIARRGIAPERNILVPTLSEGVLRTRSREEAKLELGIDPSMTLMVSVARKLKYRTLNGVTFADIHAPLLEQHPNAMLIVVGAGEPEDWAPVRAKVGDRLRSTPELPNPKLHFEAADIYVDSFPFVSSTSLMEASGYGIPSATIFMAPDEARIFGINHVALVGTVQQARSLDAYRAIVDKMIRDPAHRDALGDAAREAVAREHNTPGWMRWIEAAYAKALALPVLDNRAMLEGVETPRAGEPDWRHEDMFGGNWPTAQYLKSYMGVLPLPQRIAHWRELRRAGVFGSAVSAASHMLLPEWLKRWTKDRLLAR